MAAEAECSDENYKKGVLMTLDKAAKAFETLHITEIRSPWPAVLTRSS